MTWHRSVFGAKILHNFFCFFGFFLVFFGERFFFGFVFLFWFSIIFLLFKVCPKNILFLFFSFLENFVLLKTIREPENSKREKKNFLLLPFPIQHPRQFKEKKREKKEKRELLRGEERVHKKTKQKKKIFPTPQKHTRLSHHHPFLLFSLFSLSLSLS